MKIQSSFKGTTLQGKLYVVPTPIGNLEDMTVRAVNTLKNVSLIAAEDTRVTRKLCNYFEIETPVISYHEHNKVKSGEKVISILEEGNDVAIVSDAGTPCISDPGYEVVRDVVALGISVIALPGCNAAVTALSASGLPTEHFYFYGFLSRNKKERGKELEQLKYFKDTIIFYESPHRLKESLKQIQSVFGNRNVVLARELTKMYEEYIRGTIEEVLTHFETNELRGEFCMIVEGSSEEAEVGESWWEELSIVEHVDRYIENETLSSKDAIKKVASDRGVSKREIYQEYHQE